MVDINKHPDTGRFLAVGQHLEAWLPWLMSRTLWREPWKPLHAALGAYIVAERARIHSNIARLLVEHPGLTEEWVAAREKDSAKLARVKEILARAFAEIEEVLNG